MLTQRVTVVVHLIIAATIPVTVVHVGGCLLDLLDRSNEVVLRLLLELLILSLRDVEQIFGLASHRPIARFLRIRLLLTCLGLMASHQPHYLYVLLHGRIIFLFPVLTARLRQYFFLR